MSHKTTSAISGLTNLSVSFVNYAALQKFFSPKTLAKLVTAAVDGTQVIGFQLNRQMAVSGERPALVADVKEDVNTHVPNSMQIVRAAVNNDPSYAWSWYCNIVMPVIDAGGSRCVAVRAARNLMSNAFDYDITQHPLFEPDRKHVRPQPSVVVQKLMQGIVSKPKAIAKPKKITVTKTRAKKGTTK